MIEFLRKFPISPETIEIFEQGLISDRDKILEILEVYKFLSREQILECIQGTDEIDFASYTTKLQATRYDQNVIYYVNGATADVILRGYATFDYNRVSLALHKYNINWIRVTPFNFDLLVVPEYAPEYDADILMRRIVLEAIERHATDIHFEVKHSTLEPEYTMAFRIDTELLPYNGFHLNERLNREMISKLVETKTSASSLDLNNASGVTSVAKDIFGTGLAELRISANKCLDGYHYVIRIQKKDTTSLKIEQLGFAQPVVDDLNYVTRKRSGITLITGAVRTGKNTTAFALENEMVKQPIKLVSYEYPIEVLMPVSQVDYNNDEEILLNAIRLAKKQDVNVAFLNEIPNKEVAFAIQDLVNSSIHVITTMHLDRLWLLPYRLKEYYGSSYKDIISQINAVFNQKMFSVPCPHCQRQYLSSVIEDERKQKLLKKYNVQFVYRSTGCSKCNHTGHIIGRNQPYAEHVVFSQELVNDILKCEAPYQMEAVIREYMEEQKTRLEDYMLPAIATGKLDVESLDSIV